MSDFDKEAEREKLREKYERDQEKRKSTQRMSELLLKGATMTNRHCERCSDPIFRYDGQEFCPTCQQTGGQAAATPAGEAGGPAEENADGSAPAGSDASADANAATQTGRGTSADTDGDATAGAEAGSEHTPTRTVGGAGTDSVEPETPAESVDRAATGRPPEATAEASETRAAGSDHGRDRAKPIEREGDLTAARASLIRSVERYAEAAERTDDPRRARDYLAAAREAAETLNALDR